MTLIQLLGDEPVQWLVVIKPKLRYVDKLPTFMVSVVASDQRGALYEAKNLYPHVFNTLDRRYNDPVAKELVNNVLRKMTP